jgi:CHAD domain-containing protein
VSYRLDPRRPIDKELRRAAKERLEHARRRLSGPRAATAASVHEARKDFKKVRALLRLARPTVDPAAFRRENEALRNLGRSLADARSRAALSGALQSLASAARPAPSQRVVSRLLRTLLPPAEVRADTLERAVAALARASRSLPQALPSGGDLSALEEGLRRTYRAGRRALARARSESTPEDFHRWRKRAKDLWYQLRLLEPAWPPVLSPLAASLDELAQILGDLHDADEVAQRLARPLDSRDLEAARRSLLRAVRHRRQDLRRRALGSGERLYAEKPRAFSGRIAAYWSAAAAAGGNKMPSGGR